MPDKFDTDMNIRMLALKKKYLKALKSHYDNLIKLQAISQKGKFNEKYRTKLLSEAHHLAGNGAIFGFYELSESGHNLQNYLIQNPDAKPDSFSEKLSNLIDACHKALNSY